MLTKVLELCPNIEVLLIGHSRKHLKRSARWGQRCTVKRFYDVLCMLFAHLLVAPVCACAMNGIYVRMGDCVSLPLSCFSILCALSPSLCLCRITPFLYRCG